MSKLTFCDYHNMVAILEKTEHNTDFHQIVDFLEASPLRIETADGETHIIAKINGEQVTVSESSIRRKLKLKDMEGISDFPDTDLFENLSRMGPVNPTEPHHTPSPPNVSPPQIEQAFSLPQSQPSLPQQIHPSPSPVIQTTPQVSLPHITQTSSPTPTPIRLTKRAKRIAQSKSLTPGADKPASPPRDDIHGEAFPTATSLDARQARENIPKTSAMPHEPSLRVTSLDGGEGSMQQKLNELMAFCTTLQHQHTQMAAKIQSQDLEISQLKARIKTLEDAQKNREGVAPASATDAPAVATASIRTPTAVTSVTTRHATTYTRRERVSRGVVIESSQPSHTTSAPTFSTKGKEKMTEPKKPSKKRVQEQMSEQLAKQLEEEFAQENQAIREQVARDAEIARIQAEEDLRQMIDELDRSNEVVNKHMAEYEKAEHDLSLKEKIDLIRVLLNYQNNLAQVKKYQAQQQRLGSKIERRKFYMSVLKSHAGWKTKDFKGMTFEQIEEAFIPV
ncbi:hypothetical protein Tco_1335209 [Tanacetum coccineum]